MAVPEFILALRAKVGHDPLTLPGVTAVVLDADDRILLTKRSDNGRWALVTGCVDPGEQPPAAAIREIEEETGVLAVVERLVSVTALPLQTLHNGDQVYWYDVTVRCRAIGGEARVNDDESTEVGWFRRDELPDIPRRQLGCVADAFDAERDPLTAIAGSGDVTGNVPAHR